MQELQTGKPSTSGRPATPLLPLELCKGLPLNFLGSVGLQHGASSKANAKNAVEGILRPIDGACMSKPVHGNLTC